MKPYCVEACSKMGEMLYCGTKCYAGWVYWAMVGILIGIFMAISLAIAGYLYEKYEVRKRTYKN